MAKIIKYLLFKISTFFEYIGQYLILMSRMFNSSNSLEDHSKNIIDQILTADTDTNVYTHKHTQDNTLLFSISE